MGERRLTNRPSRVALAFSVAALLVALGTAATKPHRAEEPKPFADDSLPTDPARTVRPLASGQTFTGRGGRLAPFELVAIDDEDRIELRLGGPAFEVVWAGEIGQHHPIGVIPRYSGDAGYLLVLEAGYGASSLYTAVIALSSPGESRIVFEKVSRFGAGFVRLDPEGPEGPEGPDAIVATCGTLAGPKTVSVYCWNGDAFELTEEFRTTDLPHFELVAPPLSEPED